MISQKYKNYDEVPFYRKQLYFWLFYLIFNPIALAILISEDVYYRKNNQIHAFGPLNRLVAGLIAVNILHRLFLYLRSQGII